MTDPRTAPGHVPPPRKLAAAVLGALVLVGAAAAPPEAQEAGPRLALVAGNTAYGTAPPVESAARDARDVAAALEAQDFAVTVLLNSDGATFAAALDSFTGRAQKASAVVVYFAGHGVTVDGVNRLMPIDAPLDDAQTLAARSPALADMVARLADPGRPMVALLDANRKLPVPAGPEIMAGLSTPDVPMHSFIGMAAQPGSLVPGGSGATRGLFTRALLDNLAVSGQPLSELMIELRSTVAMESGGRQIPWDRTRLESPFFFNPFRPDPADFERLAAMPRSRQDFMLKVWRSQGAQVTREDLDALRASDGAAEAPDEGSNSDAATSTPPDEKARPQFSTVPLDEEAPAGTVTSPEREVARTSPSAGTATSPEREVARAAPSAGTATSPEREVARAAPPADHATAPEREKARTALPADVTPPSTQRTPDRTARHDDAGDAVPVDASAAGIALTPATSWEPPAVDTPIARLSADRPPMVLAALDAGHRVVPEPQRRDLIIGEDVTDSQLVPDDLPRAIQTELERLGCYRAGIDGIWGPGSRRGLDAYIRRSGAALDTREPSAEVWRSVSDATGRICPAPQARRSEPASTPQTRADTSGGTTSTATQPASPDTSSRGDDVDEESLRRSLRNTFR